MGQVNVVIGKKGDHDSFGVALVIIDHSRAMGFSAPEIIFLEESDSIESTMVKGKSVVMSGISSEISDMEIIVDLSEEFLFVASEESLAMKLNGTASCLFNKGSVACVTLWKHLFQDVRVPSILSLIEDEVSQEFISPNAKAFQFGLDEYDFPNVLADIVESSHYLSFINTYSIAQIGEALMADRKKYPYDETYLGTDINNIRYRGFTYNDYADKFTCKTTGEDLGFPTTHRDKNNKLIFTNHVLSEGDEHYIAMVSVEQNEDDMEYCLCNHRDDGNDSYDHYPMKQDDIQIVGVVCDDNNVTETYLLCVDKEKKEDI